MPKNRGTPKALNSKFMSTILTDLALALPTLKFISLITFLVGRQGVLLHAEGTACAEYDKLNYFSGG